MKRFIIIAVAGTIGLGTTAAVALARAGAGQRDKALGVSSPHVPSYVGEVSQPEGARAEMPKQNLKQPAEAQAAAPCDPKAMLPVIADAIDPRSDLGRFWEKVDIAECRNGYAWVTAITGGPPPPPPTQLEGSEQVILKDMGGAWTYLMSGSGMDCVGLPLAPDNKAACDALGLP
jgi:hypothetical protein